MTGTRLTTSGLEEPSRAGWERCRSQRLLPRGTRLRSHCAVVSRGEVTLCTVRRETHIAQIPEPVPTSRARYQLSVNVEDRTGQRGEAYVDLILLEGRAVQPVPAREGHNMVAVIFLFVSPNHFHNRYGWMVGGRGLLEVQRFTLGLVVGSPFSKHTGC